MSSKPALALMAVNIETTSKSHDVICASADKTDISSSSSAEFVVDATDSSDVLDRLKDLALLQCLWELPLYITLVRLRC